MGSSAVVNFQASSGEQGAWFEDTCRRILVSAGFTIDGAHVVFPEAGVEVDLIATNKRGISFYITCKGSYRGDRPGAKRTDTLKKAIAEAYALHQNGWGPVLLLTSHMPDTPSGIAMLASVDPVVLFDAIAPTISDRRLRWMAVADAPGLQSDLYHRRTLFTQRQERGYGKWDGKPTDKTELSGGEE